MSRSRSGGSSALVTDFSESEAVSRCARGEDRDHSAFRAIYDRYQDEVLRLALRLTGDRAIAEEVAQEAFVKLHRGLGGFDAKRPLRPWVLSIVRNAAIDRLRAEKKKPKAEPIDEARAAAPIAGDEASREALDAALGALAPEHRSVIVLRYAHEFTLVEVAEALECSERTVRNRLRAAAVLLRRELERRGVRVAAESESAREEKAS